MTNAAKYTPIDTKKRIAFVLYTLSVPFYYSGSKVQLNCEKMRAGVSMHYAEEVSRIKSLKVMVQLG